MAQVANDDSVIDHYILREGISADTDFLLKNINLAYKAIQQVNSAKGNVEASKSFKQTAEAVKGLKSEQDLLLKQQVDLEMAYRKRMALENAEAKLLAEEKELTRQRNQELKNSVREQNAAAGSIEQLRAQLIRLNKEYDNLSASDRNTATGQGLKTQIRGISDELKNLESETGRNQRNVGNYSAAVKTLEKALGDVRDKLDQYNKTGQQSEAVLNALVKEEAILTNLVESQAAGFASATAEVRNNEAALQQLQAAGLQNTQFYKDLLQETADLKDSVSDLREEIRNLGSDTSTLDGLIQGAQLLAGAYGVAQGAAALFGNENEDLEKAFVKLQAVTTILSGLEAIRNATLQQSSLMLLLNTVRTNAMALAQRAFAFATSGATAAARTFNAVLLSGGITAILLLLPLAASAMGAFGDSTEDTNASLEEQNRLLEENTRKLNAQADASEAQRNAAKGGLNELQRGLTILEASGASAEKVYNQNRQILQKEIENLQVRLETIRGNSAEETKIKEQIKDKEAELLAKRLALNKKYASDSHEVHSKSGKDSVDLAKKEADAQIALLRYTKERQLAALKEGAEDTGNPFAFRKQDLEEALQIEEDLINMDRKKELAGENVTASERVLINQKADDAILDKRKEFGKQLLTIRQSITDAEIEQAKTFAEAQQEILDKEQSDRITALSNLFENSVTQVEINANKQLTALNASYAKGKINKKQYEDQKLKIENDALRQSIEIQITYYKTLIDLSSTTAEERIDDLKKISELEKQLSGIGLGDPSKMFADYKGKTGKFLQDYKEQLKEFGNEVKDLAFSIFEGKIDKQKNEIQDRLDLLDKQKAKEIEVVNQSVQSAQDKAAAIAVIEARANAEKEQLERRKRELDQQKARFERAQSIANVIQNTAVAVSGYLAEQNYVGAVIAGAIGAAQVAKILATPIPKYKHGKNVDQFNNNYEGPAVVGDGGKSELHIKEDGSMVVTPNKPTLTFVKAKDIILPDAEKVLRQQMNRASNKALAVTSNFNNVQTLSTDSLEGTIKNMHKDFVRAVKNQPVQNIVVESPLKRWIKDGGNTRNYL